MPTPVSRVMRCRWCGAGDVKELETRQYGFLVTQVFVCKHCGRIMRYEVNFYNFFWNLGVGK